MVWLLMLFNVLLMIIRFDLIRISLHGECKFSLYLFSCFLPSLL